jgi:serine/threonine-protein kinase
VDRLPWRLPHELEWEKAARGVDGRLLPWGNSLDPALACVLGSQARDGMVPVHRFPSDESIYGVRQLVGNVWEMCGNAWQREPPREDSRVVLQPATGDEPWVMLKGGTWKDAPPMYVPAARLTTVPTHPGHRTIGFRMVRSVP